MLNKSQVIAFAQEFAGDADSVAFSFGETRLNRPEAFFERLRELGPLTEGSSSGGVRINDRGDLPVRNHG